MRRFRSAALKLALLLAAISATSAGSAWGAAGDIYLGDSSNAEVLRIPSGSATTQLVSADADFVSPNSLEFAPDGRLMVLDYGAFGGDGGLFVLDPATGQATPFVGGPPFVQPDGMVLTPGGDGMYVTDLSAKAIFHVDLSTAAVTTVASDPAISGQPDGIAVEPASGRIFMTNFGDALYAVNPQTGAVSVFSTGPASDPFSSLGGLTRLPDGTLYVLDNSDKIYRVDPISGAAVKVAEAVDAGGYDMTYDLDGNLILDGSGAVAASRVNPDTGIQTTLAPEPNASSYIEGVMVEPPPCGGRVPTIVGTTKSETIDASPFADVIAALDGDDVIRGLGGDDLICGGPGNDTVDGGDGNDQLLGEDGDDSLLGGAGDDQAIAGAGDDTVDGGDGDDQLHGEDGIDSLLGGGGDDQGDGGEGDDSIRGHAGMDLLWGRGGDDTLKGGGGKDSLKGGAKKDTLKGGGGGDTLKGGPSKDTLKGGGGKDKCSGGPGKDTEGGCEK